LRSVTSVDALATTEFCYLTTRGRRTGQPHRIEIWFVAHDEGAYLLSDSDRADWYRNLIADPSVTLEIAGESRRTTATPVERADPSNAIVRPAMVADGVGRPDRVARCLDALEYDGKALAAADAQRRQAEREAGVAHLVRE